MHPATFALTWSTRQFYHAWWFVGGELIQKRLDRRNVGKAMQARGIQPQLRSCLWAAQEQRREQRGCLVWYAEPAIHVVLEARHAAAAAFQHQTQVFQTIDGREYLGLGDIHHRGSCGFLVAA